MNRTLVTGVALATMILGFGTTSLADSRSGPRPFLSADLGMEIRKGDTGSRPRCGGGIVLAESAASMQESLEASEASGAGPRSDVELSGEIHAGVPDAGAEREIDDADLPDWTSCDPFDVNRDGSVDMADLAVLLANFGTAEGDLTGNGEVDGEDLGFLLVRISNLPRN